MAKAVGTLDLRLPIKAGPQELGVAFINKNPPGADDIWQIFPEQFRSAEYSHYGAFQSHGRG